MSKLVNKKFEVKPAIFFLNDSSGVPCHRDDDLLSIKKKDQVNQLNAMGKIKRKLCYLSKKCREKHNLIATKK